MYLILLAELGSALVVGSWYRASSRKVAGSKPDEVNGIFSMYLILPAALGSALVVVSWYRASSRGFETR
jgi:hypothetical protein